MGQRLVPTLTEVLEVEAWAQAKEESLPLNAQVDDQVPTNSVQTESAATAFDDEELRRLIASSVEEALDVLRAELVVRVEALVRQALARKHDFLI